MLRFKSFLMEELERIDELAYSVVPKTSSEITKLVKMEYIEANEILQYMYTNFKKFFKVSWDTALPMSVPAAETNKIKIRYDYDLSTLEKKLKIKFGKNYGYTFKLSTKKTTLDIKRGREVLLKIQHGEGSRNNKAGGGKAGMGFEQELTTDLINYGIKSKKKLVKHTSILEELYGILKKDYKIDLLKDKYDVAVEGGKNQKRYLSWSKGSGISFSPDGDIGKIVTDVTITAGNKKAYLSLKYTSQFFMINASIRPYMHFDIAENVTERNNMLKYLGFNPKSFCEPYGLESKVNSTPNDSTTKKNWEQILKGVLGKGYIYIVGGGSHDIVINTKTVPKVKVVSITQRQYALAGKRKYTKIALLVNIEGRAYNLDCQFRGTTPNDPMPYYMRVLVKA